MTCIIDSTTTTIVRKNGYWVIGGKLKVKDLNECVFKTAPQDRSIVVGTREQTHPNRTQRDQEQPAQEQLQQEQRSESPMETLVHTAGVVAEPDDLGLSTIKSIAGDSVWGGVAIMALILAARFLNKYFDLQASREKSVEDVSKECGNRHQTNNDSVQRVEKDVASLEKAFSELEKRISTLEIESRYLNPINTRRGEEDDSKYERTPRTYDRSGRD